MAPPLRKRGRPKGVKDSKPRKSTDDYSVNPNTKKSRLYSESINEHHPLMAELRKWKLADYSALSTAKKKHRTTVQWQTATPEERVLMENRLAERVEYERYDYNPF